MMSHFTVMPSQAEAEAAVPMLDLSERLTSARVVGFWCQFSVPTRSHVSVAVIQTWPAPGLSLSITLIATLDGHKFPAMAILRWSSEVSG